MRCIKLTYKSPMFGSVSCDDAESFGFGCIDLNPEMMEQLWDRSDELDMFLKKHYEDLAEYVGDELKDLVVKAMFGGYNQSDDGMCFLTEVYVRQEPDALQHSLIREWIAGQMSDGWGEGVEQRDFMAEDVQWTQPAFDQDECVWHTEDYKATAYYYIHPWRPEKFELEPVEREVVELDIPEEDKKQEVLEEINSTLVKLLHKLDEIM